ncbi:tyrosine-type recombinase/integrase [Cohnella sp. GCM10020058]|uniref:tyrosine-type recombinase/integrase n=1 Tax=Cohnella sp. GCM10020058 TaxID=3317330 RepID=UPI00362FB7B9
MKRSEPKFGFVSRRSPAVKFDMETQLQRFLDAKRLAKRSNETIDAYSQALGQFRKWHAEKGAPPIDSEFIRDYIRFLSFEKTRWDDHPTSPSAGVGLSARTVNNVIRNMKIFFNYLVSERVINDTPLDSIDYQTEEKETFEVFTDEDVLKLLSAPNRRVYTGRRDYCMMLVLIDGGLRIGELTNLRKTDINLKLRQIVVRGEIAKTKTTRVVPMSQRTIKELETLINYMDTGEDDYVWLTQFGERYYGDSFAKLLKMYAKRAGVTGVRVSPHTFRHYMAVKFLREGGDPMALARILGHTSLNMTQVYVRFTGTDLREQHDKASPVTNLIDDGNDRKRGKHKFR